MMESNCMNSKNLLAKYLLGGAAATALALSPVAAQAQDGMMTTTTTTTTSMPMASEEAVMVTGTVKNYLVDRAGFVSAMTVTTDGGGSEVVRFSPGKAQMLTTNFPAGSAINVWVTPNMVGGMSGKMVKKMDGTMMETKSWNARGIGMERPALLMPVNTTSDIDFLSALPYVGAGDGSMKMSGNISGKLKSVVTNMKGEVLALVLDTGEGTALVRVPAELRHTAPGMVGSNRVASLIKGSDVTVSGSPEAMRIGSLTSYGSRIAANTIEVNGKNVGSVGIQMMSSSQKNAVLGFDIGGMMGNDKMMDEQASALGYMVYEGSGGMMEGGMMEGGMTPTTMSQRATGQVMIVTADGQTLPVLKDGKMIYVTSGGMNMELKRVNGKYVVPASMTGARMMMVMSDGRRMEMDTVDGQLMVVMADGTMAPVTLHTP